MNRRSRALCEFADQLRSNPGQWMLWPTPLGWTSARTYMSAINRGAGNIPSWFATGEFEAIHRGGELLVRFKTPDGDEPSTEYERWRALDRGAIELAAAELTATTTRLLACMYKDSFLNAAEVGRRVGVGEAWVRNLLDGDGDIRIASLAKLARACGYTVSITVEPDHLGYPEETETI